MSNLNPYKNTINDILKSGNGAYGSLTNFLKKNIKDEELVNTVLNIVELKLHVAFNEGRSQGRFEASQDLKKLIDVKDPNFLDAHCKFDF